MSAMDTEIDPVSVISENIDLRRELAESHVGEVLDQLDTELVGLKPAKTRIRQIAALLLVDRVRRRMGLSSETPTLHMSFSGNPAPVRRRSLSEWPKFSMRSAISARAISSR